MLGLYSRQQRRRKVVGRPWLNEDILWACTKSVIISLCENFTSWKQSHSTT